MRPAPPTRIWLALVFMVSGMTITPKLYGQYASSPRGEAMGAFTALGSGVAALDWNPAGLTQLGSWQLSTSGAVAWTRAWNTPFMGATLGGSLENIHGFAARYSPGIIMEFSIPSIFTQQDALGSFRTTYTTQLSYAETFSLGYAIKAKENLSLGLSVHSFDERVNAPQYRRDTTNISGITASTNESVATTLTFDAGVIWKPWSVLQFGFAGRNIGRIVETRLPADLDSLTLQKKPLFRAGAAFTGWNRLTLAADVDNERRFRTGVEWSPMGSLRVRGGVYMDNSSPVFIDALGAGAGYAYGRFAVNASILKFTNQSKRSGIGSTSLLDQLSVTNLEYNVFSNDRIAVTATVTLGRTGKPDLLIEYADMTSEIFPSARGIYASQPVGRARVCNVGTVPRSARVSFWVDGVMDRPTETAPVVLKPGEAKELPFYAVLNDKFSAQKTLSIREAVIAVRSISAEDADDRYSLRVLLRGRNDWNGDAEMLKYFVTPQDTAVVSWSHDALREAKDRLDTVRAELGNYERARVLFDKLAVQMQYVQDPKLSQDNVQYPAETLSLKGGDCDDLTVLFATLLTGIGIPVAFVDVVPPKDPGNAHIYLMFDTGIEAARSSLITDNPKRFVVRPDEQGRETVWIPVETTVTANLFEAAWNIGADEYYTDVALHFGLARGWVKVVDLVLSQ